MVNRDFFVGIDWAREFARPDGFIEVQNIDFRELYQQAMPLPTATQVRQLQDQVERGMLTAYANQESEPPRALTIETMARAMDLLRSQREAMVEVMAVPMGFFEYGRPSPEAETKAETLLRSWLSPEQQKQYERSKAFEVIGCDTGQRYTITAGRSWNVIRLNDNRQVEGRVCFLPRGAPAQGAIMLAQKTALETREKEVLAIANDNRAFMMTMRDDGPCHCAACRRRWPA
jgi:hypothetical protein